MPTSHQRIRPTTSHKIADRQFREFLIDGQPWFPINDLIPFLGTTRNATQIARSLPTWTTRRLQITQRPATHMINPAGIIELLAKTPEDQRSTKGTYLNYLSRWASRNLRAPDVTLEQKIVAEVHALKGDFTKILQSMDTRTAMLESLLAKMQGGLSPDKESESP